MELNISEKKKDTFKDIPMFHTFIFEEEVYTKTSMIEAIKISQNKVFDFEDNFDVSPCVVEEMTVRKV